MTPTRKDPPPRPAPGAGRPPHGAGYPAHCDGAPGAGDELVHRPVTAAKHLDQLFEGSLPSFGGAYLRRVYKLLDEAIGRGVPMTLSVAGPVTASGQHLAWLNPLLDSGWFCLVSTTDAVCYHDGHRGLDGAREHPFHEVAIFGDDGELRDERTIRITDIGFDEDVLLEQDRFVSACLLQPEFQRSMTGTELRNLLGKYFAAQEHQNEAPEGLLALCCRKAIPIFVGAPSDGSVFLNSMKLWALARAKELDYAFELDLHGEVFESCAYHMWGQLDTPLGALGTLILGGGVPKNFNLQPEPALSQIFGFEDVSGYLYDIQITSAPVTDGSLSSCPPAEAVTWGKVDKDAYQATCESLQADYSMVMPFLAKALLDKRARFAALETEIGRETLIQRHPEAAGYLRDPDGYRLFERRAELCARLEKTVTERATALARASQYPLSAQTPAAANPSQ